MKKIVLLAFVLVLLSTAVVVGFVRPVVAQGTIYIRANGLVEGTDKIVSVDNVTYTFTDNIFNQSIVVERDNIVVDGAGYTVQGTGSGTGIQLYYTSNVTIKNTQVKAFWVSMHVASSSNNTISGNIITNNGGNGIELYGSNNTIYGNSITENYNGIVFGSGSLNNKFYHNNIINNTDQVYASVNNTWDNGVEGNYWSDYIGTDANQDGIGDTAYTAYGHAWGQDQDEYPLMGPISFFDAGTWNELTYYAHTVSNSTVSDFYFSESEKLIGFNVTGLDDTIGFCRIAIPNELLWCDNLGQWEIWVNNTLIEDRNVMEDTSYVYIYFTYNQSTQNVEVIGVHAIPEFPALASMSLILIMLAVTIVIYKRRLLKTSIH